MPTFVAGLFACDSTLYSFNGNGCSALLPSSVIGRLQCDIYDRLVCMSATIDWLIHLHAAKQGAGFTIVTIGSGIILPCLSFSRLVDRGKQNTTSSAAYANCTNDTSKQYRPMASRRSVAVSWDGKKDGRRYVVVPSRGCDLRPSIGCSVADAGATALALPRWCCRRCHYPLQVTPHSFYTEWAAEAKA